MHRCRRFALAVVLTAVFVIALPAAAAVIAAHVVEVLDGDTFRAEIAGILERVRIKGMDAPEIGEHARCVNEAELAKRAKGTLTDLLARGVVELRTQGRDRYRRVLAIVTVDGRDIAPLMVAAGVARPYRGGIRQSWCE